MGGFSSSIHVAVLPKATIFAEVVLHDGRRVAGAFFLSQAAPTHTGPETILELFNGDHRTFLPFQTSAEILLLNRNSIRMVEFESRELLHVFTRTDNTDIYALKVVLRTEVQEQALEGFVFTGDMPPDARRPVDLLNSEEPFLMLFSGGKLSLINKQSISHAVIEC